MRAPFLRLAAALQALLLMAMLVLPGLAAATEIYTDLWIYNDGDTVTVTGVDFGASEVVDLVTTDPEGTVVDTGSVSTDEAGGFVYQFVLRATMPGLYDVVATGQTSGLSAETQFDPPQLSVTGVDPTDAARPWFRTVAGGFDVTVSGTYLCSTNCTAAQNIQVELFTRNAAADTVGPAIPSTLRTLTGLVLGSTQTWSTTYQFRTSPGSGQFAILSDARYEVRVQFNYLRNPSSTPDSLSIISDDHFGVDNTAPTITGTVTPLLPANPPWYNLAQAAASLAWNCTDATSGIGTAAPSLCPAGVGPIPNGSNQSFTGTVQDRAGNSASATVSGVYVDRANPTISSSISPASPASSGWYNVSTGAPTVSFSCADTGSSLLASCTSPVLVGQGEDQSVTGTATDNAGNSATTTRSNIDVDTVAPTSTIGTVTVGATSVTVTGTASDATSEPDEMFIQLYAGVCFSGSPLDTETVNVGGSGNWSVTLSGGGFNTPGTFCILRTPFDNAGNVGSTNGHEYIADAAPSVVTTSPLNGATNVPVASNIVVTFSENVTVDLAPSWITIQCGATTVTGTTSGSGTSTVTLDPSSNLPPSTLCTVTIAGTRVHDTDLNDPPDTFTPNYVFSFTTASANTAPVLTVPASPVIAEATGPGGANVTFTVTATDVEDDPDPTPTCLPASGSLFPIGDTTVNCSVTDSGGLSDSESFVVRVVDSTDPIVTITTAETAAISGWYNIASNDAFAGVTVDVNVSDAVGATSLTCTDNGDPIAGPLNPAGDSFVLGDGVHLIECTATDAAGNDGSDSETFQIDQTAPTVTVAADRAPDSGTWYTADVTFNTSGTDATSDVSDANCTANQVYSGPSGMGLTVNGSCTDNAGNVGNGTSAAFNFDNAGPTVVISTPSDSVAASTWFNIASSGVDGVLVDVATSDDVAVTSLSCTDNGVDVGPLTATGDSFVILDGTRNIACTASDAAGNEGGDSETYKVDQTKPTGVSGAPNRPADHNGWYNAPVNVVFTGTDATSGIAGCTTVVGYDTDGENVVVPGTCTDNAGNPSDPVSSATFDYDNTNPTGVSGAPNRPADHNGWYNAPVNVVFTGTDATSGIAGCTTVVGYDTDGADVFVLGSCTDNAANTSAPVSSATFDYDNTDPFNVATALDRGPDHNGWYNHAVPWTTTGEDALSGIASCSTGTYAGPDTASTTVSGFCSDVAGNSSGLVSSAAFKYDATAPVVTATPSRAADSNGWYNHAFSVDYSATDNLSGVASCDPDDSYSGPDTDTGSLTGECTDEAGNTGSATFEFDYDATAPVVTATPSRAADSNGWYNHAFSVDYSATDNLSGVASCDADDSYAGPDTNVGSLTGECTDVAGNTGSATFEFDYDATAPVIVDLGPTTLPNGAGWYNQDVTNRWSVSDNLSGLGAVCDGAFGEAADSQSKTTSSEGLAVTVASDPCTDVAGNTASSDDSDPFKIDKTAPEIAFLSRLPAANGFGWNNSAVTVTWTCSDSLSGATTPTVADTKSAEGAGQTANGTCYDAADNSASASLGGIDIDLTSPATPTFSSALPADGASYVFGSVPPQPTCSSSDALSGLTPAGCVVTGYSTLVGTHTMTATATDRAGNVSTASRTYTVDPWTLNGFYSPVDMNGVLNTVKSGSTVPLKFEIFAGTTELTTVASIKGFKATEVACGAFALLTADEIEITSTGGTSLRYDSTGGQFIQNWATPKNRAGSCWVVTMTTLDGTSLNAFFKLK